MQKDGLQYSNMPFTFTPKTETESVPTTPTTSVGKFTFTPKPPQLQERISEKSPIGINIPGINLWGGIKKAWEAPVTQTVTKTIGGIIDPILFTPERAFAGMFKEAMGGMRDIKTREQVGEQVSPLEKLYTGFVLSPRNIPGAIKGIKEKKLLPEVVAEEGGGPKTQTAALAASFAIPAVPISKVKHIPKMAELTKNIWQSMKTVPAIQKIQDILGKGLVYRYGQPEQYAKKAEEAIIKTGLGTEKGVEIGEPIVKRTPGEQRTIAEAIKGGIVERLPEDLKKLAKPAVDEFTRLGKEAVELGLLSKEIYLENIGKYLPRMYRKFEAAKDKATTIFERKPLRADISRFMKRQDIPQDVRDAMGEIIEAGYPTVKGIGQLSQAVERAKLFRYVASNTEWVTKDDKFAKTGTKITDKLGKVYEKLPDVPTLGDLKGKYVIKEIADDINRVVASRNSVEQYIGLIHSAWKYGKVVLNLATHGRNVMSNFILADVVGKLSPWRVDVYTDALKGLAKKDADYQDLKRLGVIGTEYYSVEIKQMLDLWEKTQGSGIKKLMALAKWPGKALDKLGNAYQAEEQLFKLAVFKNQRALGKTVEEAAQLAERSIFNYRKVPPLIEALRGGGRGAGGSFLAALGMLVGSPFITFTYKALPAIARELIEDPTRIAKYPRIFNAIELYGQQATGELKEELDKEERLTPSWLKNEGEFLRQSVRLPYKDQYNRSQLLDLGFILPWMTPAEPAFNTPWLDILVAWQTGIDPFTKKELAPSYATDIEKTGAKIGYSYRQLAPPPIGISFEKLSNAVKGKEDYLGRTRDVPTTLLDIIVGLKITPMDAQEQERFLKFNLQKQMEEVKKDARKYLQRGDVSPEDKLRKQQEIRETIDRLVNQVEETIYGE